MQGSRHVTTVSRCIHLLTCYCEILVLLMWGLGECRRYRDTLGAGRFGVWSTVAVRHCVFTPVQSGRRNYPASCTEGTGSFQEVKRPKELPSLLYRGYWFIPGGKAAEAWRWPPTPSSADVKNNWSHTSSVYLCLVHVMEWPFTFTSPVNICA